jgi:hypothetical protein
MRNSCQLKSSASELSMDEEEQKGYPERSK